MSHYIRIQFNNPDDCYFLTIVTKYRLPVFISDEIKRTVKKEWYHCAEEAEGDILAYVILPDHIHTIVRQGNKSFSKWLAVFKRRINYILKPKDGTIWQPRFWEHRIKNEKDMIHAVEYIHYNPVKHRYVNNPNDYQHSSFNDFVNRGLYEKDWSSSDEKYDEWNYGE